MKKAIGTSRAREFVRMLDPIDGVKLRLSHGIEMRGQENMEASKAAS